MAPKKADICIIGGGLSGLVLAALLEKAGQDYVLVEAQGELGGAIKGQKELGFWLDHGLKSTPVGNDLASNPLLKLKENLGLHFGLETWNDSPQTLTPSGMNAFMGFGESRDRFLVEELSYYTQTPRLMISGGWYNLVEELIRRIPENRILKKAFVTKINVTEDVVTSVTLNGETSLNAKNFVFTLSPSLLRDLLPPGSVTPKTLQRIARTKPLTAVSLDILTPQKVSEAKNIFVLQENSKEKSQDPFFVIGQFISNVDPLRCPPGMASEQKNLSTWMTFVDTESMEEDEDVSKIIRTMKKIIKKAFPTLFNGSPWERLLVIPAALGQFEQMSLEDNGTLPGLINFWMGGGKTPGALRNVGRAIESAFEMANQFSFEQAETQQDTSSPDLSSTL